MKLQFNADSKTIKSQEDPMKEINVSHLFWFCWFCGIGGFVCQGIASSPSYWLPLHMHGGRADVINIHADHGDWYCWNSKADISLVLSFYSFLIVVSYLIIDIYVC